MDLNGGSVMAMCGEKCIAVISDLRFGMQFQTVSCDFEKVFEIVPTVYLGMAGLATDIQTIHETITYDKNLYMLEQKRALYPKTLVTMVSNLLYSRRFGSYYVFPLIAGLGPGPEFNPELYSTDGIGAIETSKSFLAVGCATEQLMGTCEALFKPNMNAEQLFETASQCFLNAMDRDAFTGWGAVVYLIESDKVTKTILKTRMD